MASTQIPTVLAIAGTDPTGGAGLQADIKAISETGGFPLSVVTSLVAQNTCGVREVHTPPVEFLLAQLDAVFDDVRVDAVKIGMLGTAEVTEAVPEYLDAHPVKTLVLDPVMVATSGDRLLDSAAEAALRELCRRATVITPNLPELAVLAGEPEAQDLDAAAAQGARLAAELGCAVVVKGGHLSEERADNVWVSPDGATHPAPTARVATRNTHGTGCSLSSALAGRLAAGDEPAAALAWATGWLAEAIGHADALGIGTGNGPVDHTHRSRRLAASASTTPWPEPAAVPEVLETPEDLDALAAEGLEARIAAVGPWTAALWRAAAGVAEAATTGEFVRRLTGGSLAKAQFDFYLHQDKLYLDDYSEALAEVGTRTPTGEDRLAWFHDAAETIETEAALHRAWFPEGGADAEDPSPVTLGYTSFLRATVRSEEPCVGAAAVLPCYWLYSEIGLRMADHIRADHPYRAWLETYSDEGFITQTKAAMARVERALAAGSPRGRARAVRAFLNSCHWEREFFDQASRA